MRLHTIPLLGLVIFMLVVGCGRSDEREFKFDLSSLAGNSYSCTFYHVTSSHFLQQSRSDTTTLRVTLKVEQQKDSLNLIRLKFIQLSKQSSIPLLASFQASSAIVHRRLPNRRPLESQPDLSSVTDSIYRALGDQEIEVYVNDKGNVVKVEGIDDLVSKVSAQLNEDKRTVRQILEDDVSDNAMMDYFNLIFSPVAHKQVKVGAIWGNDITLIAKAPIHISSLYTFKELKGDSAYLDIQSKIRGGNPPNFYLNGTHSGLVIISHSSGIPYLYETIGENTTTTNNYDVKATDHWLVALKKLGN